MILKSSVLTYVELSTFLPVSCPL